MGSIQARRSMSRIERTEMATALTRARQARLPSPWTDRERDLAWKRGQQRSNCARLSGGRVGVADFARAHAGALSLLRTREHEDPIAIHACRRPAVLPAVNFGYLVTPDHAVGNACCCLIHCKALAAKQLQFAREAAAVTADAALRGNHAMAWDVDRHGIIVQCVADGPRAPRSASGSAQGLVADNGAARHVLQFAQNLLLEGILRERQIDVVAKRVRIAGKVAANLVADFRDGLFVFNRIEIQTQLSDRRGEIAAGIQRVVERTSARARRDK